MKKTFKLKDVPVWEHLHHSLNHTTYADRLLWLSQAMEFVIKLNKKRKTLKIR